MVPDKTEQDILKKYKICNNCLGRLYTKKEKNTSNYIIGETIVKKHKTKEIKSSDCWLCEGLTDEIDHFVDLILDCLNEYEFDTFLVGTKVDEDILEREKELQEFAGSEFSESIKLELNRRIGLILEEKLDKEVNFDNPTIMVVLDTSYDVVTPQIKSLYVYGRYKKLRRGIPQTRWFCTVCRGKGCKRCNYTGQLYENSVEELVAEKFLEATKADSESFHGAGREDIDVLMLGNGRPFVLEIKNPKVRNIDLDKIKKSINKNFEGLVEVENVRYSDKKEIARIKQAKFNKIYNIVINSNDIINIEKLKKALLSLQGCKIKQLTPSRVAHRRANMVREKQIYKCLLSKVDGAIATIKVETESGTYIKELISGDNGRTTPNLSEMIGAPCIVKELDVIEIKGE